MMNLFKKHNGFMGRVRLSFKLKLSFLLMVLMLGAIGGSGLFFIDRIQKKVSIVSEVASPMVMANMRMGETMQCANIESMIALTMSDEGEIRNQGELLEKYEKEFRKSMSLLLPIMEKAGISFETQALKETQLAFFGQANEIIAAQIKRISVQDASLDAFEKQRKDLDSELNQLGNRALAAINEKEDRAKTLIQTGDARMGDMEVMLSELFGQDQALVQGVINLQRYLMNLQDLSRAYITEHEGDNLAGIEKEFQKTIKKSRPV